MWSAVTQQGLQDFLVDLRKPMSVRITTWSWTQKMALTVRTSLPQLRVRHGHMCHVQH